MCVCVCVCVRHRALSGRQAFARRKVCKNKTPTDESGVYHAFHIRDMTLHQKHEPQHPHHVDVSSWGRRRRRVFVSRRTILSARTYSHTPTRTCTHKYTISNTNAAWKEELTTKRDGSSRGENIAGLLFWKKNAFRLDLKKTRECFFQRARGR